MSFLVALKLEGKRCLVLGSSSEAARRARELSDAGAVVVALGSAPGPELELLSESGRITLETRDFALEDLDECWLVVLADRDADLLERVGPTCTSRRILFCAVDQPGHNGFDHVAVARAGKLSVGVSTGGTAPALGKRLRDELERGLREAGVAELAEHMAELRARIEPRERKRALTVEANRLSLSGFEVAPKSPEGREE